MKYKTTTERPKGAPKFDPSLPCDTRDPGNFRRMLCVDLADEGRPIAYETPSGSVCTTKKDGVFYNDGSPSPCDLVNVWPVLREGWTCEFIPADTEPIKSGERWCDMINEGRWVVRGIDYDSPYDRSDTSNYDYPRLRLIPPFQPELGPYDFETFPLWVTRIRDVGGHSQFSIIAVRQDGVEDMNETFSWEDLAKQFEIAGPGHDWQPAHQGGAQ